MGTRLAVVFYDKYEEVNKEKNEMKIMEYCEGGGEWWETSSKGGIFTFGREDAISCVRLAAASPGDKLKVSRPGL